MKKFFISLIFFISTFKLSAADYTENCHYCKFQGLYGNQEHFLRLALVSSKIMLPHLTTNLKTLFNYLESGCPSCFKILNINSDLSNRLEWVKSFILFKKPKIFEVIPKNLQVFPDSEDSFLPELVSPLFTPEETCQRHQSIEFCKEHQEKHHGEEGTKKRKRGFTTPSTEEEPPSSVICEPEIFLLSPNLDDLSFANSSNSGLALSPERTTEPPPGYPERIDQEEFLIPEIKAPPKKKSRSDDPKFEEVIFWMEFSDIRVRDNHEDFIHAKRAFIEFDSKYLNYVDNFSIESISLKLSQYRNLKEIEISIRSNQSLRQMNLLITTLENYLKPLIQKLQPLTVLVPGVSKIHIHYIYERVHDENQKNEDTLDEALREQLMDIIGLSTVPYSYKIDEDDSSIQIEMTLDTKTNEPNEE